MGLSIGGCLKQNITFGRYIKTGKGSVGPGPKNCKAGYETNNCWELRVKWRGLYALGEGGQHMGVPKWVLNLMPSLTLYKVYSMNGPSMSAGELPHQLGHLRQWTDRLRTAEPRLEGKTPDADRRQLAGF